MEIYVVKPGDTIQSIADNYKVTVEMLVQDNGLNPLAKLVVGQALVIAYPDITYIVKEGDTLSKIADSYGVTVMKLLMNNPYLSDRDYIYPGDIIIIKYNTKGNITTHGNTVPYISQSVLKKTLPYLTYLSILNFTATKEGEIITYYDDSEVIRMAKNYGVIPLMLVTTLTIQGDANVGIAYDILLNEDFQNKQIDNISKLLKEKGYYGINLSFEYINPTTIQLYEKYLSNIVKRLGEDGYLVFTTINTNIKNISNAVTFEKINYSTLNNLAHNIIFMNYEWATSINPPSPISSIYNIDKFLNYVSEFIAPSKEIIGMATIGSFLFQPDFPVCIP
jgi:Predicted glycosyl hydrolase